MTKTEVWGCMRWVQASPDEPAGDGHGGNGWIFTLPLRVSPLPLPLLFSPFLSPLCGYLSWHFLSFCFIFCSPLPSTGHSPNKAWQRIIIHKYVVEHSGCSNTEKVRHPAKMSSPPNAGFPLAFISMAGFIIQWVHTLFHRALPPCQEKCLVVNKHQTRACKCWLLPESCQLHRLLWQVTSILLVESKNGAFPNRLLYCLNESISTITGHHCVTHLENVLWCQSQTTSLKWILKCQQQMGDCLKNSSLSIDWLDDDMGI